MPESKSKFLGHPLHPMIVMFPVALYPIVLVLDVVWLVLGDPQWLYFAAWGALVTLLFTLAAIVPGYIDYKKAIPKTGSVLKRAKQHMWNGFAITALGALLVATHWLAGGFGLDALRGAAAIDGTWGLWSVALGAIVAMLIGVQGWLGGDLVYTHRIGIEPREGEGREDVGEGRRTVGGGHD